MQIDDTKAYELVLALWERVDSGHCPNCTDDAVAALKTVFPEGDWGAHWATIQKAEGV